MDILRQRFGTDVRILIAMELGANLGHVLRQARIAVGLRDLGNEVSFLLPQSGHGSKQVSALGFGFDVVPDPARFVDTGVGTASYAEILLGSGYGDRETFAAYLRDWESRIGSDSPDVVVVDHAPTAVVAAANLSIPVVSVGCGFTTPTDDRYQPSFVVDDFVPRGRLKKADAHVSGIVASCVRSDLAKEIGNVGDIFRDVRKIMVTLPELDWQFPRAGIPYVGPINGSPDLAVAGWRTEGRKRILAYSRRNTTRHGGIMAAAADSDHEWIIVVPDVPPIEAASSINARVQVFDIPIEMDDLLRTCDFTLGYGGLGFTSQSLLAGVPVFMLPQLREQTLNAVQAERNGVGVHLPGGPGALPLREAIETALATPGYKRSAEALAARHSDLSSQKTVDGVAASIVSHGTRHRPEVVPGPVPASR